MAFIALNAKGSVILDDGFPPFISLFTNLHYKYLISSQHYAINHLFRFDRYVKPASLCSPLFRRDSGKNITCCPLPITTFTFSLCIFATFAYASGIIDVVEVIPRTSGSPFYYLFHIFISIILNKRTQQENQLSEHHAHLSPWMHQAKRRTCCSNYRFNCAYCWRR